MPPFSFDSEQDGKCNSVIFAFLLQKGEGTNIIAADGAERTQTLVSKDALPFRENAEV